MRSVLLLLICFPLFTLAQSANGLVAHWPFDGNALDSTGHGYNGTMHNTTFVAGKAGAPATAVRFNGNTTSYITAPYQSSLNMTNYSLCALIKPEGYYTDLCQLSMIVCRGHTNTAGNFYLDFFESAFDSSCTVVDTQKYVFHTGTGPANFPYHANWQYSPNIQLNQWYSVVATFNGATFKVYVNGVLKSTPTPVSPTAIGTSTDSISIGLSLWEGITYPWWFKGVIDDLRVYNRVLSDSEIVTYNSLGIEDRINNDIAINISPNPNNGNFTLEGTIHTSHPATIEIFNMVGQMVYKDLVIPMNNQVNKPISMNKGLINGLYLLRINTGEQSKTLRFIINQ